MLSIMEIEPSRLVKVLTFVCASSRKAVCNAATWERRAPKSTALPAADNLRTKESRLTSTPSVSVLKFPSHELFKSRLFRALASVLISAFILLMGLLSIGISIFLAAPVTWRSAHWSVLRYRLYPERLLLLSEPADSAVSWYRHWSVWLSLGYLTQVQPIFLNRILHRKNDSADRGGQGHFVYVKI